MHGLTSTSTWHVAWLHHPCSPAAAPVLPMIMGSARADLLTARAPRAVLPVDYVHKKKWNDRNSTVRLLHSLSMLFFASVVVVSTVASFGPAGSGKAPPYVECPTEGVAQNDLPCPGAPGDVPLPGKPGTSACCIDMLVVMLFFHSPKHVTGTSSAFFFPTFLCFVRSSRAAC